VFSLSNLYAFCTQPNLFYGFIRVTKYSADDSKIGKLCGGNDLAASNNNLKFAWRLRQNRQTVILAHAVAEIRTGDLLSASLQLYRHTYLIGDLHL